MSKPTPASVAQERFDFDGLIVDLDGVVWLGGEPIPRAVGALVELGSRVPLVFLTNNPTESPADYAAQLQAIGIDAREEQVVTAGSALAALIGERERPGATTFVIGSAALKRELERVDLQVLNGEAGRYADVVAVGGHPGFDYDELRIAAHAVRCGARLYGAGRDATYPMPEGDWPGTGAILAAVETAGGRAATVVGKPESYLFEAAHALLGGCRRVAIVGDHLDADIAGGKRAGLRTILVLTGTTSREDLPGAAVQPDAVVDDLAELLEHGRS